MSQVDQQRQVDNIWETLSLTVILTHSYSLNEIWEQREVLHIPIPTHQQLFHWMGPDPVPNPLRGGGLATIVSSDGS